MKKFSLSIVVMLFYLNAVSQSSNMVKMAVDVVFKNIPIVLHDSIYSLDNGREVKFETLKFYLSRIQLMQNDTVVYTESNSFHLVDLARPASQSILLNLKKSVRCNEIRFQLGIDSTTNVSGAMAGDLDPTQGMYWTWQSGYINAKIEGTIITAAAPTNDFEFHLGGYQKPFYAMQTIERPIASTNLLKIVLELEPFLRSMELTTKNHIMSPSADAVRFSQQLASSFSTK